MELKKIKAVVVGYGDRGSVYANYATIHPEEMEIIAVVEPVEFKRKAAQKKFGFADDRMFADLEDFLKAKIECDIVINATMDLLHYDTTKALLTNKYNVVLEKPITPNKEQMLELESLAKANGCILLICHVLRYTPFYSKIKEIVDAGTIGEIISIQAYEHVDIGHFIKAFVRGKWRNEEECGSGMLLQKCCHDIDLICWLNNQTKPASVSSFGSKATFSEDKCPEGATEYCYQCPWNDSCIYNAYKTEIQEDTIPFYTWADVGKPLSEITLEDKIEHLKHDVFGKCIYKTGMTIVDRQSVSLNFENGSIATLHMIGATTRYGRRIHIVGTKGDIQGSINDNKFTLSVLKPVKWEYTEELIDIEELSGKSAKENAVSGHYGGDYYLMRDVVRCLNNAGTSNSITTVEDSINGHLCVYAAEESRKNKKIVCI